jgi:RNA polymerase sigma factor (sigma-70 family)
MDEASLIRAAQQGDQDAFAALVQSYDQNVLRIAMNLLRSPEEAKDVYQEAFLRVFRNLHSFRFDCSFPTWLYRIVTNICLDHLRKRKVRKEESPVLESSGGEYNVLEAVEEQRAALLTALARIGLDAVPTGDVDLDALPVVARARAQAQASAAADAAPRRRLPLMAREFLEFLSLPQAQTVIAAAGYVDRGPERQPMTADGLRLINAIQGAGQETTLDDLKRLVDVMDGADRLSLTFRFEDGSSTLDAHSQGNLADLARLLEADMFKGEALLLAGFSDGSGAAEANLALSSDRAAAVLAALRAAAPSLPEDRLPTVTAFGEALPMACDETTAGRRLNRRVELWLRPDFATADPAPAD